MKHELSTDRRAHNATRIPAHAQPRYNFPMSPDAQRLLEEARKLPPDERDWLLEHLLAEQVGTSQEAFDAWQKEVGEPEPGYEEWFRAGVEEALADTSPGTPHEEVVKEIGDLLHAARQARNLKASA